MPFTNAGRDELAKLAVGLGTPFDAANAYIAVGSSDAPEDPAHTDLQAVTEKFRKGMDPGYPMVVGNEMIFQATFTGNEANFPWYEWGICNAPVGGTLLNRRVRYEGTKLQGQTWVYQVSVPLILPPGS